MPPSSVKMCCMVVLRGMGDFHECVCQTACMQSVATALSPQGRKGVLYRGKGTVAVHSESMTTLVPVSE